MHLLVDRSCIGCAVRPIVVLHNPCDIPAFTQVDALYSVISKMFARRAVYTNQSIYSYHYHPSSQRAVFTTVGMPSLSAALVHGPQQILNPFGVKTAIWPDCQQASKPLITVTLAAQFFLITLIIVTQTGQQSSVHCSDHHPSVGRLNSEVGSVVSFDDRHVRQDARALGGRGMDVLLFSIEIFQWKIPYL
jgi:hypothetical protein